MPLWARITITGIAVLLAFLGYRLWGEARRAPGDDAPVTVFTVDGLDCPVWCAVRLSESIDALDGAEIEGLDQGSGTVTVRHDPARQDVEELSRLMRDSGFAVKGTWTKDP